MARKQPSQIVMAWDDLVFKVVPWTTEERLRRWKPLFEQTWRNGKPIVDIDDAKLILSAGWGLHQELEDWEGALELLALGRTIFDQLEHTDREWIIESEAWSYAHLGDENGLIARIHELIDLHRPRSSTLRTIPYLLRTLFDQYSPETLASYPLKEVALRFLEIRKRKRDTTKALKAQTIGELAAISSLSSD